MTSLPSVPRSQPTTATEKARYICDQDFAVGEDYNVADDGIMSYHEFLHYIALLLGRRLFDVPVIRQEWLKAVMTAAARAWLEAEQRFSVPRVRVLEVGSAKYMASSYWVSNRKSKDAGYRYRYPDVREGMRDTVAWFREVGWLDRSYRPHGAWKEYIAVK